MNIQSVSQRFIFTIVMIVGLAPVVAFADGGLQGRVTRPDGTGVSGVSVLVNETSMSTVTDPAGRFVINRLPQGTFSVTFALGNNVLTVSEVRITDAMVHLDRTVDWRVSYADTITVYAASLRNERLFDAPASIAVIGGSTLERESPHAQVPRALASTPGVEVVQSGVFDFNVNIRGMNNALNRRVLTLLDGRDPASVLIGAQEWAAVTLPMDEIARIEVVRGPGSALYGANAFNGVVEMTSKEPRHSRGGNIQFTAGETETRRVSFRHAGALTPDWFYRAHIAYGRTRDFFMARTQSVEYAGVPREVVAPADDRTQFGNVGVRLDRYFSANRSASVEGGWARSDGNVVLTSAGRIQNHDVDRPWLRGGFQASRWRASGYYDARKGEMLSLPVGNTIFDDSMKLHGDVQGRLDFAGGRGRLIGGAAYRYERADTRNRAGAFTILRGNHKSHAGAAYAQADYDVNSRTRLVFASRLDDSTLHRLEFSPKAAIVQAIADAHSVRAAYGHAFQTGSLVHYFLRTAAAPPVRLGAIETALAPALGGVRLNFDSVPVLALGNERLKKEKIDTFEAGYSGMFGGRLLVGADYYFNRIEDLLTALLPNIGTSLGRVNLQFQPYQPPAALGAAQQALVISTLRSALPATLFPLMSNDVDGSPIFAAASYTNFSRVNVQGAEFHVSFFATERLSGDLGLTFLDFSPQRQAPEDPLSANAAPRRVSAGMTYADNRRTAGVRYRWSDDFTWIGGVFRGPVPAYSVVDLSASHALPWRARIWLNVANLFDDKHYEAFGGDILRRTALLTISRGW